MAQTFVALESQNSSADAMQALIAGLMEGEIGVVSGVGSELLATENGTPNMSVNVPSGSCFIGAGTKNVFYHNSSTENLSIASNASGSARVDTVCVELDLSQSPGSDTCALVVVQGTPAAGAPSLTQTATLYQFPIADIAVANGETTIDDPADFTDRRSFLRNQDTAVQVIRGTSGDETRTTTTLANHGDFTFSAAASTVYKVRMHLLVSSPVAADIKFSWSVPSGTTYEGSSLTDNGGTTDADGFTEAAAWALDTDNADQVIMIEGLFTVSSTAGSITFQWAQNAASGTSTLYGDESYMTYEKVG